MCITRRVLRQRLASAAIAKSHPATRNYRFLYSRMSGELNLSELFSRGHLVIFVLIECSVTGQKKAGSRAGLSSVIGKHSPEEKNLDNIFVFVMFLEHRIFRVLSEFYFCRSKV